MSHRTVGRTLIALFVSAVAVTGCTDRELKPLAPCIISNVTLPVDSGGINQVDLLIVNDSSRSMQAEQAALTEAIPALIELLTSGNRPADPGFDDSIAEFEPVNMHVGVINVDLGLLDADVAAPYIEQGFCSVWGNDAILLTEGLGSGCVPELLDPAEGRFLRFIPEGDEATDETQFLADFACLSDVGTDGCFIEQQLEASLKAVTPADSTITFHDGTTGQGAGGPNDGFVRDDALLAVILVTDEDDCSMLDPELHRFPDPPYPGALNPRCFLPRNSAAVHPIQRYVDGFRAIKANPQHVIYSIITGIPPELEWAGPDSGESKVEFYDRILDHEDMVLRLGFAGNVCIDGDCNEEGDGCAEGGTCTIRAVNFLEPVVAPVPESELSDEELDSGEYEAVWPACIREVPGQLEPGYADPGRRLVEAAKAMETAEIQTLVSSICRQHPEDPARLDFSGAINDIARMIADTLAGACLPRALNPRPDGSVPCEVLELQPTGVTECDESRGRFRTEPPREEDGRILCAIQQVLPDFEAGTLPTEPGWFYDEQFFVDECPAETPQRISFTPGYEPTGGIDVRLECLQNVQGAGGEIALGGPCGTEEPLDGNCAGVSDTAHSCCNIPQFMAGGNRAECNLMTNTCMVPCQSTADCRASGLQAFSCDDRAEVDGAPNPTHNYCINPTCQQ